MIMKDFYLYLICHHFEALVASQLSPEEFGSYMSVGTRRQTRGEVLFINVKEEGLPEYFDLNRAKAETKRHSDGEPKHSKYVRTYRALEHIPLQNLGTLHLTTRDGRVMNIEPISYTEDESEGINMYCELCPSTPLVVSDLQPKAFIERMTDQMNPICFPKIFMADLLIEQEEDGHLASFLPYHHPAHIHDCIKQIDGQKSIKVVDRTPDLAAFYRTIRRGFFIGQNDRVQQYPFPSRDELDDRYHLWWRSASMG